MLPLIKSLASAQGLPGDQVTFKMSQNLCWTMITLRLEGDLEQHTYDHTISLNILPGF